MTPAAARELLGPAEGQYVVQALLGTTPGQQQNTGRDEYTIVIPEDADRAKTVGPLVCYEILWTPGPGREVEVRLYKTDCLYGSQAGGVSGTLANCITAAPGTYILSVYNPLPDDQEFSYPYTLTITGPAGTTVAITGNEAPESPQICEK
jgi:hypothetical protein